MTRWILALCGYVRLEVCGVHPERVLNACAAAGIACTASEPVDAYTLRITVRARCAETVTELAHRCQCEVKTLYRRGLPQLLRRAARYRGACAGLLVTVLAVLTSSLFIWRIDVTGNETLTTGQILRRLDECGVRPGTYWPALSNDLVRNDMILRLPELPDLLGGVVVLPVLQAALDLLPGGLQGFDLPLRLPEGILLLLQGPLLPLDLRQLRLRGGDAPGAVVPPLVQLLFQGGLRLGIGGVLLSGGDEGDDAPLQLGVGGDTQTSLPDEGAALKHLTGNAQQLFAAVLPGQVGDRLLGAGIAGGELPHRRSGAPGVADQGQVPAGHGAIHAPLHGSAVPRGIAVFLRDEASLVPLTAVDAVQHGEQKGAPGGFSGFIGCFYDVETVLQLQMLLMKLAEGGGEMVNVQREDLLSFIFIEGYGMISVPAGHIIA